MHASMGIFKVSQDVFRFENDVTAGSVVVEDRFGARMSLSGDVGSLRDLAQAANLAADRLERMSEQVSA